MNYLSLTFEYLFQDKSSKAMCNKDQGSWYGIGIVLSSEFYVGIYSVGALTLRVFLMLLRFVLKVIAAS
jgi:hypothetical protein